MEQADWNLKEYISRHRVSQIERAELIDEMIKSVSHVQSKLKCHGNIKLTNFLLTGQMNLRFTDLRPFQASKSQDFADLYQAIHEIFTESGEEPLPDIFTHPADSINSFFQENFKYLLYLYSKHRLMDKAERLIGRPEFDPKF